MNTRQRLSAVLVAVLATLGLTAGLGATAATAAPSSPVTAGAVPRVPVTGTLTDAAGGTGSFAGTFTPTRFAARDGNLIATGTLTGTLTDSTGSTIGTVTRSVSAPVAIQATCQVLDLVLGPLHLDLLGLVVDLNRVHLVINAESGPGNLLGNLLCALAGLLDGGAGAGQLAALLNAILALLSQL